MEATFREFALKDVRSNPFRDYRGNPIQPAKVATLIESIKATGFWENIEGRIVDGKLQIAYGHHRLDALREIALRENDPDAAYRFIVRDFSDSQMLQRMGCENSSTYASDLGTVIEAVGAVVRQFAEGTVTLDAVPKTTKDSSIRYAPSFLAGTGSDSREHPYTALSVARFLCSTCKDGKEAQLKIVAALAVLELQEMKIWNAERIHTFRRPDGTIPVESVLEETKNSKTRAELTRVREAAKAEQAKRDGETIKERLERAEDEKREAVQEIERTLTALRAATRMEEEKRVTQLMAEQKENEQKRQDAEKRRKQAEKEWKANKKAQRESLEYQRAEAIKAAQRREAQRRSEVKWVIDSITRILSEADTLDDQLKTLERDFGRNRRMLTREECKLLAKALDGLKDRASRHRSRWERVL